MFEVVLVTPISEVNKYKLICFNHGILMKALIKYVRSVLRQCYVIWVLLLPGTCPITKVHYPVFSEHLGLEQKKKN